MNSSAIIQLSTNKEISIYREMRWLLKGEEILKSVQLWVGATLSHSLVKSINMRGINGKIGFQNLQIKDTVIGTFVLRLLSPSHACLLLCVHYNYVVYV